ncbi:hypothetical protein [Corallococcus exercitus]|uniref:hypothetical protein n=1 Tax=Corallococcus exercitus TaxID=2316736 RepID=UPI0035D43CCB
MLLSKNDFLPEHRFENGRSGEEAASRASAFLVPGLWNIDLGEIDHDELFERIRRNEPVFTETKKHPGMESA